MICAVCDAGPLTHLWQIHLWSAFQVFHCLHIPEQVVREVSDNVPFEQLAKIAGCPIQIYPVEEDRKTSNHSNSADQVIEKLFVHSTLYLSPQFKTYVRKLIATYTSRG